MRLITVLQPFFATAFNIFKLRKYLIIFALSLVAASYANAATFTVTKVADTNDGVCDTDCSLREAIAQANMAASDDVIEFDSVIFNTNQTIILLLGQLEFANNGSITVSGRGRDSNNNYFVTVSGNNNSRIFYVNLLTNSVISGLRVIQGKAVGDSGGAIYNNGGNLALTTITAETNTADSSGGGIFSINGSNPASQLTISNSIIRSNSANQSGGGIYSGSKLVISGSTTLNNNTVSNSTGLGGGIYVSGQTNISTIYMYFNVSFRGGGVYNDGGELTITDSTIPANTASNGGGIYTTGVFNLINSQLTGNVGILSGGGIYNNGGTLSVSTTAFDQNRSQNGDGGAIANVNGTADISRSVFAINQATGSGAGISQNGGTLSLITSIMDSNNATVNGGGIISTGGILNITNSTLAGNTANDFGGAVYNLPSSTVNIINATIVLNNANLDGNLTGNGGGIYNSQGGSVNARSTIIAENTDSSTFAPDFSGVINSLGHNLIQNTRNTTGTLSSDIIEQSPQLLPRAYYGGPTRTFALKPTSPAIDAGDPNNFPATDQRGISRPQDGDLNGSAIPDIGAFERQVVMYKVTKTADTNDGVCNSDCSLREAVAAVNSAVTPDNAITFDSAVFNTPQTIALTGGAITVTSTSSVALIGPGVSLLSIDCLTNSAIGASNQANLAISNVTITGSTSGTSGRVFNGTGTRLALNNVLVKNGASGLPGLWNFGTATVNNSTFTDNFPGNGITNDLDATLTVTNSQITHNGGGISNSRGGRLDISFTTISDNTGGSGIFNSDGNVVLDSVLIKNNIRTNGFRNDGGGIYSFSDNFLNTFVIKNSIISGNIVSGENSVGGGIANLGSQMTISNCLVTNNRSINSMGGGIYSRSTLNIVNSTINENRAFSDGGGIFAIANTNLTSTTIVNNEANRGGGVFRDSFNTDATVKARNTIVADNSATTLFPDFAGTLTSQGFNLIENTTGTTITGVTTGNILGQDPQLLPLRNYGGTTQTVALQPNSPAIDAGDPNNFPATDQRGIVRPQDGDLNGTALPDIGAYERQVTVFTVTKTADTNDGNCDSDCSLREAVAASNAATTYDNAVVFNPTFSTPQTITLSSGEISIAGNRSLIINGSNPNLLTFSGNSTNRHFFVSPDALLMIKGAKLTNGNGAGASNSGLGGSIYNQNGYLTLSNSIITGNTANSGGGIYSDGGFMLLGNLSVTNSSISNNTSQQDGGGVVILGKKGIFTNSVISGNISTQNSGGGISTTGINELIIDSSKVDGNSAISGGGIYCFGCGVININYSSISSNTSSNNSGGIESDGILTILNSTISNNTSQVNGGGIYNKGVAQPVTIKNSTVSGNSASLGGGIFNGNSARMTIENSTIAFNIGNLGGGINTTSLGAILNAKNTIIARNTANTGVPDFYGTLTSQGYNLIGDTFGTTITGTTTGNILNIDPQLLPLRNNGGFTKTHALRKSSPAIDKGSLIAGITTDQRNLVRPFDFAIFPNASGGNGSDIGAFERQTFESFADPLFDFDGDSKTDIAIFRPTVGEWWYLRSSDSSNRAFQFGTSADKPVPADYTGDGKTDVAIFRPSTGEWLVLRSEDSSFYGFPFGTNGDIPAPADYDGDGKSDAAVFRPTTGTWYISKSSGGTLIQSFGANGDKPVVADYDGDGKADLAIYRVAVGEWWYLRSSDGANRAFQFGTATDKPIQGDYTGDGKADVAIFRPASGEWFILRSEDSSFYGFPFGTNGDIPASGDYDGDGKFDAAIFRPSSATWYINGSTSGVQIVGFGANGDIPVASSFVP